jgi:hypothetical protein
MMIIYLYCINYLFNENLKIKDLKGNLLLSKGTELTDMLLMRLYHTSKVREIQEPILIIEPYKK